MIKTNFELAAAAEKVAKSHKTLYVLGCFGAPMNASNKNRYSNNLDYNKQDARKKKILNASAYTFGFDCVCFIKGLLWGWEGNTSHQYGGATYQSNGVPDINANSMIKACKDVSTDFSKIQPGEAVWIEGHIGIYIGDGLAVESTPIWKDGVQITAVHNIGTKSGYNGRTWTKHGKLPYITYEAEKPVKNGECTVTLRVIDGNSKGDDVRAMQLLLEANGCKGAMNSAYYGASGNNTVAAIEMFQRKVGLPVTSKCDEATWKKLLGL